MRPELCSQLSDILQAEGFRPVGSLGYRLSLSVWWHPAPDKRLQVIVLDVGRAALLRADKTYYLTSVTALGETWARDVGPLHDYLEGHFPEVRVAFSHFRDVPPGLAEQEVRRRTAAEAPTHTPPTVEELARLQQQLRAKQDEAQSAHDVLGLMGNPGDLLGGYLRQQVRIGRTEAGRLNEQVRRERERLGLMQHLQREYRRKGSAAVYTFSVSSDLQAADGPESFRDALRIAVKEVLDMDRYQVRQKLSGGRLQIQVDPATDPAMAWVEQWLGGALTPSQLHRLGPALAAVREAADAHAFVTPDEPITAEARAGEDGPVRHDAKRVAAHVVSDMVSRLDPAESAGPAACTPQSVPAEAMPLNLGRHVARDGTAGERAVFPLGQIVHLFASGTTGSGKSYFARVLVEEAAGHEGLGVLVLDPRNQSVGLLAREDRPAVLSRYAEFGIDPGKARGFAFRYFAPAMVFAPALPSDLRALASGRSVVSLKGLDDATRCAVAADVLDAAFDACATGESDRPRLLVVVDEAQLFTRPRVEEDAKTAAARAERAIERIAREGRKLGINLVCVTQSFKDAPSALRQMMATKVFLRNSDREIEYAGDVLGNGKLLVQLPTGVALVHNANWGTARISVRPPYSKVFEPAEEDVRRLVGRDAGRSAAISAGADRFLDALRGHRGDGPLNLSQAAKLSGVTSKRRLMELVGELETAGLIRTRKLAERGQPRVIELAT